MGEFAFTDDGRLVVTPSTMSSKNDFDFYVGQWKIRNGKLNSRLTNSDEWTEFEADQEMEIILNGLGNTDNFVASFDGEPFEGRNLRLFNPETKLWSMYWVDSSSVVLQTPTVGSFDGDIGRFYDLDTYDGQEILVKFQWDRTDPLNPVWSQAFSVDKGETWEWNWYMYCRRAV